MYAVIETGGKQYQVKEGDEIFVEKLGAEEGEVTFDKVLLIGKDGSVTAGAPYVSGASVKATLLKNGKGKKSEKRAKGHRQPYSKVKIDAINA